VVDPCPCASPLPPKGLVEFKNPYSYRDSLLQEAIDSKKYHCLTSIEGHFSLKCSHEYYHQVQFAMLCTGWTWCDFFISAKEIFGERIEYDEEFCLSLVPKLKRFCFCAILSRTDWFTSTNTWAQGVANWWSFVDAASGVHNGIFSNFSVKVASPCTSPYCKLCITCWNITTLFTALVSVFAGPSSIKNDHEALHTTRAKLRKKNFQS